MNSNFAQRVAYGRRIQEEAEQLMAQHGTQAREAAVERGNSVGLTLSDEAFYRAVEERVVRLMGYRVSRQMA